MALRDIRCLLAGLLLTVTLVASGQNTVDIEGGRDHPLIVRYPGSIIRFHDLSAFREYILPLGPLSGDTYARSRKLEGKVTRITYDAPQSRSVIDIFRAFETQLDALDFETLYVAPGSDLGDAWLERFGAPYLKGEGRYLAARLPRLEGDCHVALYIGKGAYDFPLIQLDIIEIKPMDSDQARLNAAVLAGEIERTGRAAIYGIRFAPRKADIPVDSWGEVSAIATLLTQNPNLNLLVVGHTDNSAPQDVSMSLSLRRAQAIVKLLVSMHNIPPSRLQSFGLGPLAPTASNRTEQGRALNRRIELVER